MITFIHSQMHCYSKDFCTLTVNCTSTKNLYRLNAKLTGNLLASEFTVKVLIYNSLHVNKIYIHDIY